MKALSRGISFATVALLLIAGSASATLVPVGDPLDTGSWGQRFNESGVGYYDYMEVFWISGGPFEDPAFANFSVSGWAQTGENSGGTVATADGPQVTSMDFDISFQGSQASPLAFTFQAWRGNTWLEAANASWNGSGWSIVAGSKLPRAPEPISMVMLGCVGAGMFVARKLRGKRAA